MARRAPVVCDTRVEETARVVSRHTELSLKVLPHCIFLHVLLVRTLNCKLPAMMHSYRSWSASVEGAHAGLLSTSKLFRRVLYAGSSPVQQPEGGVVVMMEHLYFSHHSTVNVVNLMYTGAACVSQTSVLRSIKPATRTRHRQSVG